MCYNTEWEKNVKDLTNFPGMEELSPPDHVIHLRLANHIHSASFHVPVARTVLLSLILHRIAQKSHPHGEAPLAWRERCEHNLLAALENNKAAGLQLHVLPAPVTKPPKSGSFPHNGQPRWFVLTALGTLPPGEASGCSLHLARYYCIFCIYGAVAQIQSYWWGSAAHVSNICAWFSGVSPALPGCCCCCLAAQGTAQHRLPRAGHRHGCLLPVHQQEDEVPRVNG